MSSDVRIMQEQSESSYHKTDAMSKYKHAWNNFFKKTENLGKEIECLSKEIKDKMNQMEVLELKLQ